MNKNEMVSEIRAYMEHFIFAEDCLTAYKTLIDETNQNNDKINLSPGFFTLTLHALSKCLCMEVAKLYCGSGKEKTLNKLIGIVAANQNLFPKSIEDGWFDQNDQQYTKLVPFNIQDHIKTIEDFISNNSQTIICLKTRRDKFLAHNDPEYFDGKLSIPEYLPLELSILERLIEFPIDFCNELLNVLEKTVIAYPTEGSDDLKKLLQNIKI